MVLVQNWPPYFFFPPFYFFGNIKSRKCDIFPKGLSKNEKIFPPFLGYKKAKSWKSMNWHFSKGVSPWFWSKIGHFSTLFFLFNIGLENVFYYILERKNAFLGYKNKKLKKSKNWHFSKGVSPWFWSKIGHFSTLFLLFNIGQANAFYDILEPINAFLGYKNKNLKKSKNWHFSKRVSPWFWSKIGNFPPYFFI